MAEEKVRHKKFVFEVFFVALAQWIPVATGFVALPFITKILGVDKYGIWSQLMATVTLIYPIAILGLCTALRRFLPGKTKEEVKNDFWAAVIVVLANSVIFALILYIFSPYFTNLFFKTNQALSVLRIGAFLIPLLALNQIFLEYFVTLGKSKIYAAFVIVKESVNTGLAIYLVVTGKGLVALVLALSGCLFISTFIAAGIMIKNLGFAWPNFKALRPYFALGLPIFLSGIAYWIINSSGKYFLGYFSGIESVGVFSIAYNLASVIFFIATPIWFVLLPAISKFWEEGDRQGVVKYLERALEYFLIIAIPAIFGLAVLGKQILGLISTPKVAGWWFLLPFFAFGMLVYQALQLAEYVLILQKKTGIILRYVIIMALINMALNFIFVPFMGLFGAVLANSLTYCFYGIMIFFVSRKYLKFGARYAIILKSVAASVLMSAAVFLLNTAGAGSVFLSVLEGVLIYGLFLFIIKGADLNDIKLLWK